MRCADNSPKYSSALNPTTRSICTNPERYKGSVATLGRRAQRRCSDTKSTTDLESTAKPLRAPLTSLALTNQFSASN